MTDDHHTGSTPDGELAARDHELEVIRPRVTMALRTMAERVEAPRGDWAEIGAGGTTVARSRRLLAVAAAAVLLIAGAFVIHARSAARSTDVVTAPEVATSIGPTTSVKRDTVTTAPGSASTTPPLDAPMATTIETVQFTSPSTAFAADDAGTITRTDDGGATWVVAHPGDGRRIGKLDLIDAEHGWALGPDVTLHTTDGTTWTEVPPIDGHRLSDVHLVSPTQGWGVIGDWESAGDRSVVTTTDGVTWTTLPGAPTDARDVCFTTSHGGWLATPTMVFRTDDGGRSWTPTLDVSNLETTASADARLQCARPDSAWVQFRLGGAAAGSSAYAIYHSADAGAHWSPVAASLVGSQIGTDQTAGSYPGPFSVIDANTAFFVAFTPAAPDLGGRWTTDGSTLGESLPIVTNNGADGGFEPFSASFASRDTGVVTGRGPGNLPWILVTADGGATWNAATLPPSPTPPSK